MAQELVLEKERKRRKATVEFLQWLESIGGFIAELGRMLVWLGLAIARVAQIVRGLLGYGDDWRQEYV